jgi:hypothetical protein
VAESIGEVKGDEDVATFTDKDYSNYTGEETEPKEISLVEASPEVEQETVINKIDKNEIDDDKLYEE